MASVRWCGFTQEWRISNLPAWFLTAIFPLYGTTLLTPTRPLLKAETTSLLQAHLPLSDYKGLLPRHLHSFSLIPRPSWPFLVCPPMVLAQHFTEFSGELSFLPAMSFYAICYWTLAILAATSAHPSRVPDLTPTLISTVCRSHWRHWLIVLAIYMYVFLPCHVSASPCYVINLLGATLLCHHLFICRVAASNMWTSQSCCCCCCCTLGDIIHLVQTSREVI